MCIIGCLEVTCQCELCELVYHVIQWMLCAPCRVGLVSRASRSTSVLGGKERLVTFARYSWHVGMQLLHDVIAYTFAPACFDEMFAQSKWMFARSVRADHDYNGYALQAAYLVEHPW